MKKHQLLILATLLGTMYSLSAEVQPWSPDIRYDTSRAGFEDSDTPWGLSPEARDAENTLRHVLEAHKQAVILGLGFPPHNGLDQKAYERVKAISGCLGDVVTSEYLRILPYFKKKSNPTLLLMMLYHFEVYCAGGDGDESWPWIIEHFQKLDPATTAKAKEMAKKGKADLHRIAEKTEPGADQPATKRADKVPAKDKSSTPTPKDRPR